MTADRPSPTPAAAPSPTPPASPPESSPPESSALAADPREIVITRQLRAPRALVWAAFTDPRHVAHWWGPDGFTSTIHEMDVRPGGVWRLVMHGPDGVDYDNRMRFTEVVKPERLVYEHGADVEGDPALFRTTVTFVEEDGGTRVTMRMRFATPEARRRTEEEFGAVEGGRQTLRRLAEYLTTL